MNMHEGIDRNRFRLITLNTWKSSGNYSLRIRAMANGLRELCPTLICLQESFHSVDNQWNTAEFLAKVLAMDFRLVSYRRKQRPLDRLPTDSYSGLAVLSRYPIEKSSELQLETVALDGERIAQITTVSLANIPLTVVNLHLTHLPDYAALRVRQLDHVLAYCCRQNLANTLICGDFNAPFSLFSEAGGLAGRERLQDTWRTIHGELPQPSTIHANYRDPVMETETGSIDHILYLRGAGPGLQFIASDIVLDGPDPDFGVVPSDHCGVCLDFITPQ